MRTNVPPGVPGRQRSGRRPVATFLEMVGEERDVYQLARLYEQCRHPPENYIQYLICPRCRSAKLQIEDPSVACSECGSVYPLKDNVLDLRGNEPDGSEWYRLTEQFQNYHRSLTPHTLLCSAPTINYVAHRTGLRWVRELRVLDVGGGTGHTLCSFFRHPESLDYYLLDPNLRLLHDQFVRVYPELLSLPMSHFLGVAEDIPFAAETFDLVVSQSAIDHYRDYQAFMREAFRVLRPGGAILISSHLDRDAPSNTTRSRVRKLISLSVFEGIARRLFYAKHRVGRDDHTFHFESVEPVAHSLSTVGFTLEQTEEFKGFFYVLGRRPGEAGTE